MKQSYHVKRKMQVAVLGVDSCSGPKLTEAVSFGGVDVEKRGKMVQNNFRKMRRHQASGRSGGAVFKDEFAIIRRVVDTPTNTPISMVGPWIVKDDAAEQLKMFPARFYSLLCGCTLANTAAIYLLLSLPELLCPKQLEADLRCYTFMA